MDTIEKEVEQHEKRNLVVFAANQIFMRARLDFQD